MAIIFNLFKLVGMSHHICEPSRAYCLVYELILLSPFSYVINRLYQIQIKEGEKYYISEHHTNNEPYI